MILEHLKDFKETGHQTVYDDLDDLCCYNTYNSELIQKASDGVDNKRLYLGVENELEFWEDTTVDLITNPYIIYASDGSMEYGFEMKSNPMTLEAHKNWIWNEVLDHLANQYNVRNPESDLDCNGGLHIHCSADYMSKERWNKLFDWFENNQDFIFKLTRRQPKNFRQWSKFRKDFVNYGFKVKDIDIFDKYNAYRTTNKKGEGTVEFRIFNATYNHTHLFQYLHLIAGLVEYFKTLKSLRKTDVSLNDVVQYLIKEPILSDYLIEMGIIENDGKIKYNEFEYIQFHTNIMRLPTMLVKKIREAEITYNQFYDLNISEFDIRNKKFKTLKDVSDWIDDKKFNKVESPSINYCGCFLKDLSYINRLYDVITEAGGD
jgi:hypothetical protein